MPLERIALLASAALLAAGVLPGAISCDDGDEEEETRVCRDYCEAVAACAEDEFEQDYDSEADCLDECEQEAADLEGEDCYDETMSFYGCFYHELLRAECDEETATEECESELSDMLGCEDEDDGGEGYCAPGCPEDWIGDGVCDEDCENEACDWDGGDCDDVSYCAPGCLDSWIGDGICDEDCHNEACDWDGGDCD